MEPLPSTRFPKGATCSRCSKFARLQLPESSGGPSGSCSARSMSPAISKVCSWRRCPPTGIRGRIAYREAPLGKPVLLALQGAGGAFAQILVENAAGGAFANLQLLPDRYTIRSFGREHFVRAVLEDGEPLAGNIVDLALGRIRDLQILLSRDFARVSGRVKKPESGAPAAFYRVALRGPHGVSGVQADQYARFRFEKVAPGGYEICAWPDAGLPQVKSGGIWQQAGGAVRSFPVDAGANIEISLTAAR